MRGQKEGQGTAWTSAVIRSGKPKRDWRLEGGQGLEIQDRAFQFAVRVVKLANRLPRTVAGIEVGRQLVRAATSVGANLEEADAAESKADFVHKVGIAHKEAREARYWLRIVRASLLDDEEVVSLLRESEELVRVLNTIVSNARRNPRSKVGR
ncbi:MAG: four helix bundle protein [Anaerolineae bacterium]|nr:four helix bundle protein [Anaerolineae bacterium]